MTSRKTDDDSDDEELSEAYKAFVSSGVDDDDGDGDGDGDGDRVGDVLIGADVTRAREAFVRARLEDKVVNGDDFDGSARKQLEELEQKQAQAQRASEASAGVQWFVHSLFLLAAVYFGWRFFTGGGYSALGQLRQSLTA